MAVLRYQQIQPIFGSRANAHILVLRGIIGSTAMTLNFFSLTYLTLADATAVFFTNPALVRATQPAEGGTSGALLFCTHSGVGQALSRSLEHLRPELLLS